MRRRANAIVLVILLGSFCMNAPLRAQSDNGRSFPTSARPAPAHIPSSVSDSGNRPLRITKNDRQPGESAEGQSQSSRAKPPSLWTTLGAMLAVIVLILGVAKIWKKHGPRLALGLPSEVIEVLGRRGVDHRQSILLVRLGSRILVLGSSREGLQRLAEIDDPVEVDFLAGQCRSNSADRNVAQTFRALFNGHSSSREQNRAVRRAAQQTETHSDSFSIGAEPRVDLEDIHA